MTRAKSIEPTARAQGLRKNSTIIERVMWKHLRARRLGGYKFRRQQPLGPYVVDFVCLERRLVVELDGGQHDQRRDEDMVREEWLRINDFKVLRFWNNQVLHELAAVKEQIFGCLESRK